MLRILSFLEEATGTELVLPVTPASYQWEHPSAIETIQLDQAGERNLFGGRAMGRCTLTDVLLPAQRYPFCHPSANLNPYVYLERLERWCDAGTVVRFLVSGTPTNAQVLIESVTQGERDGTNDLYVTIALREYRKPEVPVLSVHGGGASTARPSETGAATAKSYTVQKGDCLWTIAERFYGDGAQYKKLAAANPAITNPNLIYPGQVLTIPAADYLPGAAADAPSVALAASVQWDAVAQRFS